MKTCSDQAQPQLSVEQKADLIVAMVGDDVMKLARQIRTEMEREIVGAAGQTIKPSGKTAGFPE